MDAEDIVNVAHQLFIQKAEECPLIGPQSIRIKNTQEALTHHIAKHPSPKHLPVSHRHNVWILSINNREPADAADTVNIFKSLQLKGKVSTISIYLVPETGDNTRTRLEENQVMFTQIQFRQYDTVVNSSSAAFLYITCFTPLHLLSRR
eukprot:1072903-Ditylum_brightwellii.AAC.1